MINRGYFLRLCGFAGIGALPGCAGNSSDDSTPTPANTLSTGTSRDWTRQAKFTAGDADFGDRFGFSVAMSSDGTTALVGAVSESGPGHEDTDATENQNGDTTCPTGSPNSGNEGPVEDREERQEGAVYVFTASDESWSQQAKLTVDGDDKDRFGFSVTVSGDDTTAVIGSVWDEGPSGGRTGSAYVFDNSGGSWRRQAKLIPDDGDRKDAFGVSVAVSNDGGTALIGAPGTFDPDSGGQGSAYIYEVFDGFWRQQATLPLDGGEGEQFGRSVALSGDGSTSLIGDPQNFMNGARPPGAAYVFTL